MPIDVIQSRTLDVQNMISWARVTYVNCSFIPRLFVLDFVLQISDFSPKLRDKIQNGKPSPGYVNCTVNLYSTAVSQVVAHICTLPTYVYSCILHVPMTPPLTSSWCVGLLWTSLYWSGRSQGITRVSVGLPLTLLWQHGCFCWWLFTVSYWAGNCAGNSITSRS